MKDEKVLGNSMWVDLRNFDRRNNSSKNDSTTKVVSAAFILVDC